MRKREDEKKESEVEADAETEVADIVEGQDEGERWLSRESEERVVYPLIPMCPSIDEEGFLRRDAVVSNLLTFYNGINY